MRYILDNLHSGKLERGAIPPRDDFISGQGRRIYDIVISAPSRSTAEAELSALELDDVDIESFLRLSGEHYYTYPELVRRRAEAIRRGELQIETA